MFNLFLSAFLITFGVLLACMVSFLIFLRITIFLNGGISKEANKDVDI